MSNSESAPSCLTLTRAAAPARGQDTYDGRKETALHQRWKYAFTTKSQILRFGNIILTCISDKTENYRQGIFANSSSPTFHTIVTFPRPSKNSHRLKVDGMSDPLGQGLSYSCCNFRPKQINLQNAMSQTPTLFTALVG